MILKQNTFNLVVETASSSEISSASLSNPFRESETSRNKIPKSDKQATTAREFVFKVIDNLSWVIDFYWSIKSNCQRKPSRGERWGSADFLETFTI